MTYEDILQDLKGTGRFLKYFKVIFVIPVSILVPWFWMSVFFMLSIPDHWCNVPVVRYSNLSTMEQRSLISPPGDPSCTMYDLDYKSLLNDGNFSFSEETNTMQCSNGWQYDTENYDSTVVTKWDLVCDKSYYLSVIYTLQKAGNFIGTPLFGLSSDKFGRRSIVFAVAIVTAVTEALTVFLNNLVAFMVLRVLSSTILSTSMTLLSIFCIELVPPENRASTTGAINIAWTVGLSIQPLIAYRTRNWTALAVCNALAGAFILCYWKFLPESPCWLISKGKYEEAATILKRIGDKNGTKPDREVLLKKVEALGDEIEKSKEAETFSKFNLLKYPRLRKNFLLITLSWLTNSIGYGGLLYNVRNMSGNEFMNYFLLAIVEIPGNVAFMIFMDRCGRRWTSSLAFLTSGIFCLAPVTDLPYSELVAAMAGKFLFSGNYMVTDQQASELYPTVTRTFGIGVSKTIVGALTVFLPYLADLDAYGKKLPFVLISISCFVAGVAVSFLPETLNENLPQTTSEAEEFGKDQKYFSWKRKAKEPKIVSTIA